MRESYSCYAVATCSAMRRRLAHKLILAVSAAALIASPLAAEIAAAKENTKENRASKEAAEQPEKAWSRWIPQRYSNSAIVGSQVTQRRWWAEFQNPELDELQAIAAANNADLKVAVARVAQAEARARNSMPGSLPRLTPSFVQSVVRPNSGSAPPQRAGTIAVARSIRQVCGLAMKSICGAKDLIRKRLLLRKFALAPLRGKPLDCRWPPMWRQPTSKFSPFVKGSRWPKPTLIRRAKLA